MSNEESCGILQISSASNCTDFQSRRLGITYQTHSGDIRHCHTVSICWLLMELINWTVCSCILSFTAVCIVSCLFCYIALYFCLYTLPVSNRFCLTTDRLRCLNLPSLELRRLHTDLIYCYVFGRTDLPLSDYFQMSPLLNTRGHKFKLYKKRCSAIVRSKFFSERVVNTWNILPSSVDFSSLSSFIRTVKLADLSDYLRCFVFNNSISFQ